MSEIANKYRIPSNHRARFEDGCILIDGFAQKYLDEELTGFALELWARLCRRRSDEVMRGLLPVWVASVIQVIARMNFLFDKAQPVHLTFSTICEHFDTKKTTVGNKATQIEKLLKLNTYAEPGLCRENFVDSFTFYELPNGMVLTGDMVRKMGLLPPRE